MNTVEEIANILKSVKSAVIFTHMRPDGDTLGSGMALSRALSMLGIENEVVNADPVPEKFFFLPGMKEIRTAPTLNAEAYVCVDSSETGRLGDLEEVFLAGAKKKKITINVDHHISNTRYAKYNYVNICSANCENVSELIDALGVQKDKQIADYLMTGLITDSGNFTHSDVNGRTFRIAASAADAGADCNTINYELFRKQKRARAAAYAEVISHLRYELDDRLAIALIPLELLARHCATQDMTEGFVDFALTVDTVEVSVSLMEVKKGQYKASFRSKGKTNVNAIAAVYGGGGHILASGCMMFGEIEEVIDKLRYTVSQHLAE